MIFAKTKPTRQAFTIGIANPDLIPPAERDNVAVSSAAVLDRDARLVKLHAAHAPARQGFQVHDHQAGRVAQVVLSVPAYDFGWQTYYVLRSRWTCPGDRGSTAWPISTTPANNPYNPDPTKMVRWGEQTFEEMMIGYLDMDVPVGRPAMARLTSAPPRSGSARARSRPCSGRRRQLARIGQRKASAQGKARRRERSAMNRS